MKRIINTTFGLSICFLFASWGVALFSGRTEWWQLVSIISILLVWGCLALVKTELFIDPSPKEEAHIWTEEDFMIAKCPSDDAVVVGPQYRVARRFGDIWSFEDSRVPGTRFFSIGEAQEYIDRCLHREPSLKNYSLHTADGEPIINTF